MSVDQNSRNPNRKPTTVPPPPFQIACSSTADDHSSRKVKLLCSFGGNILPRPSDGALRYAGGQTRIIAIGRDTSLHKLYRKMVEAYGGPVAIRYQLPDEDLDALVSVSSAEDLDNMMDEYDKLTDASSDGSAKLRVFLFSPSEIAAAAAEMFSAGITGTDPYDSGQRYIEAINGAGIGGIHRKDSTASAASTQNSDVLGDGSNNEGTSPTIDSPSAAVTASHDSSRLAFVGNATSATENQGFRANSTMVGQAKLTAQVLNPPPVVPYASQAFVEPQQVQYITPHSLAMAGGPRLINVVAVPQHLCIPPMHIPPPSVPLRVGNLKQVLETVESYFEGNQNGGRILQLVPDQNFKVCQQPLSQLPPLHPSNVQPQSVEQYGLHPLLPLPKGQGFWLEDCQMCQKALPDAHSDTVLNEQGNLSVISTSEVRSALCSHHSKDITGLQVQHREVSVAMMENLVEPKVENIVIPGQFGAYGVNQVPEQMLEEEKLVVPIAEKFDHSKSKQVLDPVGLSGDTEASYGALENPSQPCHESKLLQQLQVLHAGHFEHTKVLHLPVTIGSSSTSSASYGVSLNPPQPLHDDSLQKKMAEQFDHAKVFHPPCFMGLTGTAQTSYGVFLGPPQPYHEDSLQYQQQQKQPLQATTPPQFAVKQDAIQKQFGQGFSTMENVEFHASEPLSNSVQVFYHDYVKPVDGMMEISHVSAFENLRLNEQLKPVVPDLIVSEDMESEKSSLVGAQNHAMRPLNGANQLISCNTFVNPGIVSEVVSAGPVNSIFSNIGTSKDMKPEISSVVGVENNTVRPHNGGNAFLLGNAFLSPGILPEVNSRRVINPLLSSMSNHMHLHNFQYANTTHISTSVANQGLFSQNFERIVEPSMPHDVVPGITPCHTDYDYRNAINESPDGEQKDEASLVRSKDLDNDMTALPRGNAPFQFYYSSCTPGHIEQLVETSASDSLFCNQDPWKVFGTVHMCAPRPTTLASSEPVLKEMFIENFVPNTKGSDIAILLEEGALLPLVNSLSKDSHPEPFQATQDCVKQDLRELVEQVGESVLQSSITSAPGPYSLEPNESSPTFPNWSRISEDMANSNSIAVLGDQKLEDMKIKQSDKVHLGVPLADDIGRLQIIKNSDLEELRELGSGTFGTVFHGKWKGSDVAIKRINDRCFSGKPSEQERMRADFWNEASKLADLHHPNVVAFYGIVLDGPGGSFATVTEYMVNGSLRNALQSSEKTLDRRKRLLIATDVAFGMEYLHGKSIVHFDLKSDNLLVNLRDPQRPICKVGDLGLSKVKCKTLISGGVRGTLPWMAPELLNGSSSLVSVKVDVFSFGIVMWELLTGQEPYADLHYGAIIGGIVNNSLRPPVPESCDPEWKALMEQCWSAEPSGRPSFTEIANRLRFMAASLSQKAQAPSVQPQPHK